MLCIILITLISIAIIFYFSIKSFQFWTKKNVKQKSPIFIAYENWKTFFRINKPFTDTIMDAYNEYPNTRYSGTYMLLIPVLIIKDLELIKQITVKDFDHFVDHRAFADTKSDPLWSNSLLTLSGERWREMRSTLSPAFTSNKMRYMFKLIGENAKQFVQFFLNEKQNLIVVEMKDIFTIFANDVIANTAFGIECDSLTNRKNEFYLMGKQVTNFATLSRNLKMFGYLLMPKLFSFFKISLFSKDEADFFKQIVQQTIQIREKQNIVRPDMINLLLQAKKHELKYEEHNETNQDAGFATVQESEIGKSQKHRKHEITDLDITSQALSFFFAGFDSVSGLMSFTSYELALHPDIQKRLQEEVDETSRICGEKKLTYEALLNMKYMDMVISEALRKWPNSIATDRICTKTYTIQPALPDETPLILNKNDSIWIPIYALHRDPQYYPDPNKFDPERFNEENRHKIKPYTYLPFGIGPRGCIGSRFAILETKALFYYLLLHFDIVPIEKTQIPLKLSRKQFTVTAENGFWLGLKRRNPIK